MDVNFLHTKYTPDDIMARWPAVDMRAAKAGMTNIAASAGANDGYDGNDCNDDCESYIWDEGCGRGSNGWQESAPAGGRAAMDEDETSCLEASPSPVITAAAASARAAAPQQQRQLQHAISMGLRRNHDLKNLGQRALDR